MKRLIFLLLCGCCAAGCGQRQIARNLNKLYEATIRFPDSLERVVGGGEPVRAEWSGRAVKLVSYYPPSACTSCTVNQLEKWKPVFDLSADGRFVPIILFSPDERGYRSLIATLKFLGPEYPVYVDKRNEFQRLNPVVPNETRFQTLLLDRNDHVVLVGNPLAGDAMWKLFRSTLDNMLAHDGEYVPEK